MLRLWSKSRFISKIQILQNVRSFKNQFVDEKPISQNGIWIAGRPWSRWDPPGPEKPPNTLKCRKFRNLDRRRRRGVFDVFL